MHTKRPPKTPVKIIIFGSVQFVELKETGDAKELQKVPPPLTERRAGAERRCRRRRRTQENAAKADAVVSTSIAPARQPVKGKPPAAVAGCLGLRGILEKAERAG